MMQGKIRGSRPMKGNLISCVQLLGSLLCLSSWLTVGCSSKQCLFESDCAPGLVCAESVCRQGCDENRQCPADFSCQAGACLPSSDVMCAVGETCETDVQLPLSEDMLLDSIDDMGLEMLLDGQLNAELDSGGGTDSEFDSPETMLDALFMEPVDMSVIDDPRSSLAGSYMVVHTLVLGPGGGLSEGDDERNNIDLSSIGANRYRMEVRDELGRDLIFVQASVNFAHREGAGYYDFNYAWNSELPDVCYHVQVRSQDGTYRQGPRGFTLLGSENRVTCTCYPEPITDTVPTIERDLCTGSYYQQVFNVEWIPWN